MRRGRQKTAPDVETFKKILKDKGLRATTQRVAVHEAMLQLGHASADMVADQISKSGGAAITIASVYNILSGLADMKIYDRRLSPDSKMYFDVNTFKHLHIYDTRNNEFKDVIDDELIALVEDHLKDRTIKGYRIDSIDIQLCAHPARKRRKTEPSAE